MGQWPGVSRSGSSPDSGRARPTGLFSLFCHFELRGCRLRPPDLTGTLLCREIPSCILPSQGRSQKLTFPVSLQSSQGVGLRSSNQMHQPRTMQVQMCGIYFLRRIGGRGWTTGPSPSVPGLVSVGSAVGSVTSSNSNEISAAAT